MKYGKEWTKYKGDYDKEYYDIKLKKRMHGRLYVTYCYPNAGNFHELNGDLIVPEENVDEIRLSKHLPHYLTD